MDARDALKVHRWTLEDWLARNDGSWQFEVDIHMIQSAETYFVSADMCDVLEATWESCPVDSTAVEPDELPSQYGFLLLERTINRDFHANSEPANGYLWAYTDAGDQAGTLAFLPLGITQDLPLDHPQQVLATLRRGPNDGGSMTRDFTRAKPLRAALAFMRQKIAVTTREPGPRAEQRRCLNVGLPTDVNVVRVRKRENSRSTHAAAVDVDPDPPLGRVGALAKPVPALPRRTPAGLDRQLRQRPRGQAAGGQGPGYGVGPMTRRVVRGLLGGDNVKHIRKKAAA